MNRIEKLQVQLEQYNWDLRVSENPTYKQEVVRKIRIVSKLIKNAGYKETRISVNRRFEQ